MEGVSAANLRPVAVCVSLKQSVNNRIKPKTNRNYGIRAPHFLFKGFPGRLASIGKSLFASTAFTFLVGLKGDLHS